MSQVVDRSSGVLDSLAVVSDVFLVSMSISISNTPHRRPMCRTMKRGAGDRGHDVPFFLSPKQQ